MPKTLKYCLDDNNENVIGETFGRNTQNGHPLEYKIIKIYPKDYNKLGRIEVEIIKSNIRGLINHKIDFILENHLKDIKI